jgi:hypothetical protein
MEKEKIDFHEKILKDLKIFFETTKRNFIRNRNRIASPEVLAAENKIEMIARWFQGDLIETPRWFIEEALTVFRKYMGIKFLADKVIMNEGSLAIRNIEKWIEIKEQLEETNQKTFLD